MQSANSLQTSFLSTPPTESETTPIAVTTGATQEPYCFMQEGTLHSDVDTHIQGLSDKRSSDQYRLQHFRSLRDLVASEHQDKLELTLEVGQGTAGQWNYAFLLNQSPIYTSERQTIGDGRDLAAFQAEHLRQNFLDPADFEKFGEALQGFQASVREASSQTEILVAFQKLKNEVPQNEVGKLAIQFEYSQEPGGTAMQRQNENITYRLDIHANRGVTTIYRSALVENAKNIVAYASYFGVYKQLAEELSQRGIPLLAQPGIMPHVAMFEQPLLNVSADADIDSIVTQAFSNLSNLAIPCGIDARINLLDEDKFQLEMGNKVLFEGNIRSTQADSALSGPSARFLITRSALALARYQIALAYESIGENFAAYKRCNPDGVELAGPTLQDAMQDQNDKVIQIEAQRIMNQAQGPFSHSYHLIVHSAGSSEARFFAIPESGLVTSGKADASQCETLLKALSVDAKHRIYDKSIPLLDTFNRMLFLESKRSIKHAS